MVQYVYLPTFLPFLRGSDFARKFYYITMSEGILNGSVVLCV